MHAWSVIAGDHFFSNYCTLLLHKSYNNQASRRRLFFVSLWCLMASAQLSIRTCRHGGGEHVVLAATAVCMCLQREEGLRNFFDIIAITYEKGAKSSLYRALPDITSNPRYIGSPPCQQISSSLYRPFRYSGPRYIGPPTNCINNEQELERSDSGATTSLRI